MLVFSSNSSPGSPQGNKVTIFPGPQSRHFQGLLAESGLLYLESGSDFKASGDLSAKGSASDRCKMISERHFGTAKVMVASTTFPRHVMLAENSLIRVWVDEIR